VNPLDQAAAIYLAVMGAGALAWGLFELGRWLARRARR
jgi:hypothetical protein